jgi:hypothetical protein
MSTRHPLVSAYRRRLVDARLAMAQDNIQFRMSNWRMGYRRRVAVATRQRHTHREAEDQFAQVMSAWAPLSNLVYDRLSEKLNLVAFPGL